MNKANFILIIFFFISTNGVSQQFNYGTSSIGRLVNSYSVKLPPSASPWLTPNDGVSTAPAIGAAATSAFVEFGDGTFSFLPNGNHDFITANKEIITKATGVYGGGGKPPAYRIAAPITGSASYTPMNILAGSSPDALAITPNIGSVLAEDTMILVVTYKTLKSGASLLFLFNDNTIPAFENIIVGQNMVDVHTGSSADFLRTYAGENEISVSSGSVTLVNARNASNQYTNSLAVKNLITNGSEHNIFITLIPRAGLLTTSLSQTKIKAVLVWDNTTVAKPAGDNKNNTVPASGNINQEITLPVVDLAHDPNYITVNPVCMLLPKVGKTLDYKVHFQNTGLGRASKVRVEVKIQGNVDLNSDINYQTNFYLVENGVKTPATPLVSSSGGNKLVFEFVPKLTMPCTLEGLDASPTNLCSTKTMGDIWFTINTTNLMQDILMAQASIIFYNASTGLANDPVITNTAVTQFRACCDCTKKCDPCKNTKGLWKWLFCKKC
jgi:hypothetical protein